MQPAVKEVAGKVVPATKDVTEGVIRPGGEAISEKAVPPDGGVRQQALPARRRAGSALA